MRKIFGVVCFAASVGMFILVALATFYEIIAHTIDLSFLWSFALWMIPGVILLVLGKHLIQARIVKEEKQCQITRLNRDFTGR